MPLKVLLLCATERGRVCAEKLFDVLPDATFTVCSFKEEAHEPLFILDIQQTTEQRGHRFINTTKVEQLADNFDLILAISWRYMVPEFFYSKARLGAFVFHDSLLPTYRGFSPTVWAMINRERYTGASLIRMAPEVDSGEIIGQIPVEISPLDYISDVMSRVTASYLVLIERHIKDIANGIVRTMGVRLLRSSLGLEPWPSPSYCSKFLPDDARIDWNKTSEQIDALVRAYNRPYPGAFTKLSDNSALTIWRAQRVDRRYIGYIPGRVVAIVGGGLDVACGGGGVLRLTSVQWRGREPEGEAFNPGLVFKSLSTTFV